MISKIIIKGGPGSGHFGHAGRQGKRGGSLPSGVALSVRTGKDRIERQAKAAGKKLMSQPPAKKKPIGVSQEWWDEHPDYQEHFMEFREIGTWDDVHETEWGGGYIVSGPDQPERFIDISDEFGGGTNDHPGAAVAISNPETLGISKETANIMMEEDLRMIEHGMSDDYDWNVWQDKYMDVWNEMTDSGIHRVRFQSDGPRTKGNLSFQLSTLNDRALTMIQEWGEYDLFPNKSRVDRVFIETWDMSGWIQTSYEGFMNAESVDDIPEILKQLTNSTDGSAEPPEASSTRRKLAIAITGYNSEEAPQTVLKQPTRVVVIKGGPGSGHYGHAGRPGKRGGSLPSGVALSIRTGRTAQERQRAAAGGGVQGLLHRMRTGKLTRDKQEYDVTGVSQTYSATLPDGTKVHVKTRSLHGDTEHEALAYEVSQLVEGYEDLIPPTVLREDNSSVHVWVSDATPAIILFRGTESKEEWFGITGGNNDEDMRRMYLFDAVFGNGDRHYGNFLIKDTGKGIVAIDNDQMFGSTWGSVFSRIVAAEDGLRNNFGIDKPYTTDDYKPFIKLLDNDRFKELFPIKQRWSESRIADAYESLQEMELVVDMS